MAHSSLVENFERRLITMMFRLMWAALMLFAFIYLCKKIWFGWLKDHITKESKEETSNEEKDSESK